MNPSLLVPAQVRAARGLLSWSQDKLADSAEIALSSVRDFENQKRTAESQVASAILRALTEAGVTFIRGNEEAGPGVRLNADRPNLIRRPTVVTKFDGIPFEAEWRGKRLSVFVSREAIEDLGRLRDEDDDRAYLEVWERNKGRILDGLRKALLAGEQPDRHGHLRLTGQYIDVD